MIFIFFIFGLIIGSFLNAVLFRLRSGISIADGRSKCLHCHHVLEAEDLFPVLSFIWLRGKCRYCGQKISWQYPLVELAAAVLFVAVYVLAPASFLSTGAGLLMVARNLFAVAILLAIFVYDARYLEIPDQLSLPAIAVILLINILLEQSIASILLGGVIGFGFFGLQYAVSKGKWIGGGDLRLGALMGVLLGWPNILFALFAAYLVGAIVSLILLATKKATGKTALPFGVFLAPAAIVAMFWGEAIIRWYLGLMG